MRDPQYIYKDYDKADLKYFKQFILSNDKYLEFPPLNPIGGIENDFSENKYFIEIDYTSFEARIYDLNFKIVDSFTIADLLHSDIFPYYC